MDRKYEKLTKSSPTFNFCYFLQIQTPQKALPKVTPVAVTAAAAGVSPAQRLAQGNLIRIRSPIVNQVQQASVATTEPSTSLATAVPTTIQQPFAMSGIAALAAAAAATPKMSMNNAVAGTTTQVLQTTAGGTPIRVKGMQPGQQIRFASPGATVLRAASPQQGKQIILQKPGTQGVGGQQIVHLLKTGQGMMMPKVSLIPGKTVQAGGVKPINQGATILRLVNPNSVGAGKIITTMKSSQLVQMSKGQNIAGKYYNYIFYLFRKKKKSND